MNTKLFIACVLHSVSCFAMQFPLNDVLEQTKNISLDNKVGNRLDVFVTPFVNDVQGKVSSFEFRAIEGVYRLPVNLVAQKAVMDPPFSGQWRLDPKQEFKVQVIAADGNTTLMIDDMHILTTLIVTKDGPDGIQIKKQ